jgi:hypothetical protein
MNVVDAGTERLGAIARALRSFFGSALIVGVRKRLVTRGEAAVARVMPQLRFAKARPSSFPCEDQMGLRMPWRPLPEKSRREELGDRRKAALTQDALGYSLLHGGGRGGGEDP